MAEPKLLAAYTRTSDTISSVNADYAEVGEWADGNPNNENRIGYFVSVDITAPGITMVKSKSKSDVRGVTIASSGFVANQSDSKCDDNKELLPQYDYVGFVGFMPVIDNGTCTINGKCMPADDGTAVPSTNGYGYHVMDRVDSTHVLILVEPQGDAINRIETEIAGLKTNFQDGVDKIYKASVTAGSTPADKSLEKVVTAIEAIKTGTTADADHILEGKIAYSKGKKVEGSMANNTSKDVLLDSLTTDSTYGTSYTIPAGYHDGAGKVYIATQEKSATPGTTSKTILPDKGKCLSKVTVDALTNTAIYHEYDSDSDEHKLTFKVPPMTEKGKFTFINIIFIGSGKSSTTPSMTYMNIYPFDIVIDPDRSNSPVASSGYKVKVGSTNHESHTVIDNTNFSTSTLTSGDADEYASRTTYQLSAFYYYKRGVLNVTLPSSAYYYNDYSGCALYITFGAL